MRQCLAAGGARERDEPGRPRRLNCSSRKRAEPDRRREAAPAQAPRRRPAPRPEAQGGRTGTAGRSRKPPDIPVAEDAARLGRHATAPTTRRPPPNGASDHAADDGTASRTNPKRQQLVPAQRRRPRAAPGPGKGQGGDQRRQRNRRPPVHLGRWPRLLVLARLRLLRGGQLRARRRRLPQAPLASGQLESWGAPGPGSWITVYANAGHAYAVIAGPALGHGRRRQRHRPPLASRRSPTRKASSNATRPATEMRLQVSARPGRGRRRGDRLGGRRRCSSAPTKATPFDAQQKEEALRAAHQTESLAALSVGQLDQRRRLLQGGGRLQPARVRSDRQLPARRRGADRDRLRGVGAGGRTRRLRTGSRLPDRRDAGSAAARPRRQRALLLPGHLRRGGEGRRRTAVRLRPRRRPRPRPLPAPGPRHAAGRSRPRRSSCSSAAPGSTSTGRSTATGRRPRPSPSAAPP